MFSIFRSLLLFFSIALALTPLVSAWSAEHMKKIVLIGGPKSHGLGEHDFYHGVQLFKTMLEASEEVKGLEGVTIEAFPFEWPEAEALEGASTLVFYFDGVQNHPLLDERRRAQVAKLMGEGAGLVTLHQAFTVPVDDKSIDFPAWLGGVRYGTYDRTMETVRLTLGASDHPVSRGLGEITFYGEFYPTIRFTEGPAGITPILRGSMRPQFVENTPVVSEPRSSVAAWAFQREGGGRSFGFSGGHYLMAWDQPSLRTMLMNAIFWTAGIEVPKNGVQTNVDASAALKLAYPGRVRGRITQAIVSRPEDNKVVQYPWGHLVWHVSGELGNSDTMTTGIATIAQGKSNPRHIHPNCDEILHVLKGHIRHTMNDITVEMRTGDTVSIPQGFYHNATNIGEGDAVLAISFSSAWREVVGE